VRQHVRYLLALMSVMGCGHTDPFTDPDNAEDGPFAAGDPLRLTYNVGVDGFPFYLPGDSLIGYAFARPGATNSNQCFGVLPVGGGTTISESCPRTAASLDSTERFEVGVPLSADSVLLLNVTRRFGRLTDDVGYIGRAPWRDATSFSVIQRFPIQTPSGSIEFPPSHMALTGDGHVAYLATTISSACPGLDPTCPDPIRPVPLVHGLEIAQVPLTGGAIQVLSGTAFATSMAAGRAPGSVIFTLPLDTQVYERDGAGNITVLVDMLQGPAARDVQLHGDSVVAITGGPVEVYILPDGQLLQSVTPGNISIGRISTGEASVVVPGAWARPSFSSDGTKLVAQSFDTGAGDVYTVTLP